MSIRALLAERATISGDAETKLYKSISKRYPHYKSLRSIARGNQKVPKDTQFSPFADTVKELTDLGWVTVSKSRVIKLTSKGKKAHKISSAAYDVARTNREKHAATPRGRKALGIEKADREAFLAKRRHRQNSPRSAL